MHKQAELYQTWVLTQNAGPANLVKSNGDTCSTHHCCMHANRHLAERRSPAVPIANGKAKPATTVYASTGTDGVKERKMASQVLRSSPLEPLHLKLHRSPISTAIPTAYTTTAPVHRPQDLHPHSFTFTFNQLPTIRLTRQRPSLHCHHSTILEPTVPYLRLISIQPSSLHLRPY